MKYGIVIPNKYPDIIQPLLASLKAHEQGPRVIIVADGHSDSYGYELIRHDMDFFSYSKAVNMGIEVLVNDGLDVVLLNDDIVLLDDHPFCRLAEVMDDFPIVGVLSPLIRGCVGNEAQSYHMKAKHWNRFETIKLIWGANPVCFPCVYLRREMITHIGMLSEKIVGYGGEDNEYCLRARSNGWITAVVSGVVVQHGTGGAERGDGRGKTWSLSFARRYPHGIPRALHFSGRP